jgi:hypothetical protein
VGGNCLTDSAIPKAAAWIRKQCWADIHLQSAPALLKVRVLCYHLGALVFEKLATAKHA